MISQGAVRRILCVLIVPVIIFSTVLVLRSGFDNIPGLESITGSSTPPEDEQEKPEPLHKLPSGEPPAPPIVDNFPLAAAAKSPSDLPSIPPWNTPPSPHVEEATPLFIGFTRNWRLLQQTVVSYITAGWPPEDIYVVENTGVMHSNMLGQLTLQNPFYIDHHRLTKILRVNVLRTPTLFTFAQLQNFYTYTSLERGWSHYFWAHMDTIVISDEEMPVTEKEPYKSLYSRAVAVLQETLDPAWGPLAMRWFAYDRLALVRTQAFVEVGGWDTLIPFYMTDCDMHERLWMKGLKIEDATAGKVWDVASSLDDLAALYKRGAEAPKVEGDKPPPRSKERREDGGGSAATADDDDEKKAKGASKSPDTSSSASPPEHPDTPAALWSPTDLASPAYQFLLEGADVLQRAKAENPSGRNTWQARQRGGKGEPFYRDPDGFEHGVWMWMDFGRKVFEEKWGRGPCDIRDAGLKDEDAWQVVVGWEDEKVRKEWWRDKEKMEKEMQKKEKEEAEKEAETKGEAKRNLT